MKHELPVYGPTDLYSDEDHAPAVIVRVDYALSRKQLETALSIGFAEIAADRDPQALTVAEVRVEVEGFLAAQGLFEISRQMEADRLRVFPPEQQRVLQLLAEAAERAYPAQSPTADRCPAAHPDDPTPCGGPVVVTVLDAHNAGADGCEHHAARLLASLDGGRVYALPDAPDGAAIRVFKAAGGIRPFPWVERGGDQ